MKLSQLSYILKHRHPTFGIGMDRKCFNPVVIGISWGWGFENLNPNLNLTLKPKVELMPMLGLVGMIND